MTVLKTAVTLAVGMLIALSVAALAYDDADNQDAKNRAVTGLVLDELATVDWIEKSDVAALREGVIERMELKLGDPSAANQTIGYLHRETARLTVAKAKVQAESTGAIEKAKAASEVAASKLARDHRLNERKPGMVSAEDMAKDEGEFKMAEAQIKEALENQKFAKADLDLAIQALEEHIIRSPFDGYVIKRMKNPGESVRANEAVVQVGKLSRLCANTYVPLKYAFKVKLGQTVEIHPRVVSSEESNKIKDIALEEGRSEIESLKFQGKITFVDPQIQAIAETARRIRAEFDNPDFKLLPGMKVQMTIFLTDDVAARTPRPGTR
jgi:RND family efflux transporter MFP subunit